MKIRNYDADFIKALPKTYKILSSGGLNVHAAVTAVAVCGLRILNKSHIANYDIDLWLEIGTRTIPADEKLAKDFIDSILDTTLNNWQERLSLNIFIAFGIVNCDLCCLKTTGFKQCSINASMTDCFGVYRRDDNFHGFLNGAGCNIGDLLPFMPV